MPDLFKIRFIKAGFFFCCLFLSFSLVAQSDGDTLAAAEEDKIDEVTTGNTNRFDSVGNGHDSYTAYAIPDTVVEGLKKDKNFWYADYAEVKKKEKPIKIAQSFYYKPWFKRLVWIIIIVCFVGVLIRFLIASDVKLFRKKSKRLEQEGSAISDDIFSVDYTKEMAKAFAAGDYSAATRLMYLHVLSVMAGKELIQYKIERTNSDYLMQLYGTGYYKDFFRLTRHFEYVFYGKFIPSEAAFQQIMQAYTALKNSLNA